MKNGFERNEAPEAGKDAEPSPEGTKRVFLSPPDVGEEERNLLLDAFDSNWIAPLGPHVDAFEREVAAQTGSRYAVALSSGTAALHLALLVSGVESGDKVLTSTLTFAATANAITYVGAKPVFVDVDPRTWQLSPGLVAEELEVCRRRGRLPKAVIAVDLYGQCADYDALVDTCGAYGVLLIEDAAEALGATYKNRPAGSLGDAAILSFNGNKIITTSGGGMLLSDNKSWCDLARSLASQAREPAAHYQHTRIGYNYRLSNLLAAVGRAQLRGLERRVARRRAHRAGYKRGLAELAGVEFMPEAVYGQSNAWLTCITRDEERCPASPESVRLALEDWNIEARPVWKPLHLQPVFSGCRIRGGRVSEGLFARGLCLPSGSAMSDAERDRVVDIVRDAVTSGPVDRKRD